MNQMNENKVSLHIEAVDEAVFSNEDFDFNTEDELDFLDDGFGSGMPSELDVLIINANIATFDTAFGYSNRYPKNYGSLQDAAIAVYQGKIVWIGSNYAALSYIEEQSSDVNRKKIDIYDAQWKWITPGLIDCHTHLVYAGNRSIEFEARLEGIGYRKIQEQGGGILSTVNATRNASQDKLYKESEKRLQAMILEGVTSVEIKSGYGLSLESEEKMLKTARQLGNDYGITVKTTYLAAHTLPIEFEDNADAYIDEVCKWMSILHEKQLIDAVEVLTADIGFNIDQTAKVFEAAQALGLPVKIQAERTTNIGGSRLVAEYRGLSSSHLEHLVESDIMRMATSDTVAVLLPAAFYSMQEELLPPIEAMRRHDLPIAIATDCNPETSPMTSIQLAMNMGCTLFGMTPAEVLAGVTCNAAKALDLSTKGRVSVGMDADLLVWEIDRPADLSYFIGLNPLSRIMINGLWR